MKTAVTIRSRGKGLAVLFLLSLGALFSLPASAMTLTIKSLTNNEFYTSTTTVQLYMSNMCNGGWVSGIVQVKNIPDGTLTPYSGAWQLLSGYGTKSVQAQVPCSNGQYSWLDYGWDSIFLDDIAPTVLATTPASNASAIELLLPSISATFSENVIGVSAASFTVDKGLTGTVSYDQATRTATFAPAAPLAQATTYTASLGTAITDLAGNVLLPAGYSWRFTTPRIVTDSVAPIDDLSVDFGAVTAGTTRDETVTFTNHTTSVVTLGTVGDADALAAPFNVVTDGCSGQTLTPGASCMLTVRFAPATEGSSDDSFTITSDYTAAPAFTVGVNGQGVLTAVPHIGVNDSVAPTADLAIDFGNVQNGTVSHAQSITLHNSGNAALVLGAAGTSDPLAAPFSIAADGCSGNTLPPAASCTLTVYFTPMANGTVSDSFDIASNDPTSPSLTFQLGGTGVSSATPHITITDSLGDSNDLALPFGTTTIGKVSDHTLTITNTGNADLLVGDIAATNPLEPPYTLVSDACSGQTLPATAQCTITIRHAPTKKVITNDSLTIPSNDTASPELIVTVSGAGAVAVVLTPSSGGGSGEWLAGLLLLAMLMRSRVTGRKATK